MRCPCQSSLPECSSASNRTCIHGPSYWRHTHGFFSSQSRALVCENFAATGHNERILPTTHQMHHDCYSPRLLRVPGFPFKRTSTTRSKDDNVLMLGKQVSGQLKRAAACKGLFFTTSFWRVEKPFHVSKGCSTCAPKAAGLHG